MQLNIKMNDQEMRELKRLADNEYRTKSGMIRALIKREIARIKEAEPHAQ